MTQVSKNLVACGGSALAPNIAGKSAAVFNGAGLNGGTAAFWDRISIAASNALCFTTSGTLELMVKPYTLTGIAGVGTGALRIASHGIFGANQFRWLLFNGTGSLTRRLLATIGRGDGSDAGTVGWVGGLDAFFVDAWTIIHVVFDLTNAVNSERVRFYVNGVRDVGTPPAYPSALLGTSTSPIDLGHWQNTSSHGWDGEEREFSVFNNRQYSQAEITQRVYELNNGLPPAGNAPVSDANLACRVRCDGDAYDEAGTSAVTIVGTPPRGVRFVPANPGSNPPSTRPGRRIFMFEGDSLTAGSQYDENDTASAKCAYRNVMLDCLRSGTLLDQVPRDFQVVGNIADTNPPAYFPTAYRFHDGVPGQLIDDPSGFGGAQTMLQRLPGAIAALIAAGTPPTDIVFMGGTNDLGHTYTAAQTDTHAQTLIDATYVAMAGYAFRFWVCTIPPYAAVAPNDQTYVTLLAARVATNKLLGRDVRLIDFFSALHNPEDFAADVIHLRRATYGKAGVVGARALAVI